MNLKEFIEIKYDIRNRISDKKRNPLEDFINNDIFPYDFIEVQDGAPVKMLYYADGKKEIAVLDLLSYKKEDLLKHNDLDLRELYENYTKCIEFEQLDLLDPIKLSSILKKDV